MFTDDTIDLIFFYTKDKLQLASVNKYMLNAFKNHIEKYKSIVFDNRPPRCKCCLNKKKRRNLNSLDNCNASLCLLLIDLEFYKKDTISINFENINTYTLKIEMPQGRYVNKGIDNDSDIDYNSDTSEDSMCNGLVNYKYSEKDLIDFLNEIIKAKTEKLYLSSIFGHLKKRCEWVKNVVKNTAATFLELQCVESFDVSKLEFSDSIRDMTICSTNVNKSIDLLWLNNIADKKVSLIYCNETRLNRGTCVFEKGVINIKYLSLGIMTTEQIGSHHNIYNFDQIVFPECTYLDLSIYADTISAEKFILPENLTLFGNNLITFKIKLNMLKGPINKIKRLFDTLSKSIEHIYIELINIKMSCASINKICLRHITNLKTVSLITKIPNVEQFDRFIDRHSIYKLKVIANNKIIYKN